MRTITIQITVPDGVDVQVATTPPQNGPGRPPTPQVAPSGAMPSCPTHGPDKVKASTKGPGFFCSAHDENGPRGYCSWSVR